MGRVKKGVECGAGAPWTGCAEEDQQEALQAESPSALPSCRVSLPAHREIRRDAGGASQPWHRRAPLSRIPFSSPPIRG